MHRQHNAELPKKEPLQWRIVWVPLPLRGHLPDVIQLPADLNLRVNPTAWTVLGGSNNGTFNPLMFHQRHTM